MSMGMPADRSGQRFYLPGVTAALGLTAFFLASHATLSYAQTMALPGSFSVGASGAATYNIPIAVPPGTAGMSPSLTLEYNSQGGNGLLGVGWSLGGLPSVGRCARTLTQDGVVGGVNYDGNDRFCFEGQRLIAISGTYGADGAEYRTEVESFTRVISHGTAGTGPAWFEVHTKSGQVMELGHTADSLVLAQGKPTARTWALNKLSDTKGNYLTATYTNDTTNGQFYPIEIDYTGNAAAVSPANKVQFVYATRPDIVAQYQAGSLMRTTVRLTDVQTYSGAALVGDYKLVYQQSPTSSVSEIASVSICGSAGVCLPSTQLQWTSGGASTFSVVGSLYPRGLNFGSSVSTNYVQLSGDFNGDGKSDFALLNGNDSCVFLSNGDGTFSAVCSAYPGGLSFGTPITPNYAVLSGDFNGDGKSDFAIMVDKIYYTFLSNGDGTFSVTGHTNPSSLSFGTPISPNYLSLSGDFNGDGKSDFALLNGNDSCVFLSNGDGTFSAVCSAHPGGLSFGTPITPNYAVLSGDFNGDGKSDFAIMVDKIYYTFLSNGDGTFSVTGHTNPSSLSFGTPVSPNYLSLSGDFNGDGKSDFALLSGNDSCVFLSNGDGTFSAVCSAYPGGLSFGTPITPNYAVLSGDFNGDGKSDFAIMVDKIYYTFLSNGDGTFSVTGHTNPSSLSFGTPISPNYTPVLGDFNGDGRSDFVLIGTFYYSFLDQGSSGDFITSVTNGLGAMIAISYLPLTNSTAYTKDVNATYPVQDLQSPLYVVSRVDTSNGVGGTYSSSYSYAGAKADLSGRGFLGFRQVAATDLQTNIVQTTMYRQDFPYIGLAASTTKSLNALTLNRTATSYQFSNASGTSSVGAPSGAGAPYKVSVAQSVAQSSDLDGTALPSVTTTYQYDGFGNPTQVVASTPDGFSKTTTNTYTNDATHWLLGRLTRASVSSVAP